ncbi:MAG: M23 family metallopeptidase [Mucinivorans sp.]
MSQQINTATSQLHYYLRQNFVLPLRMWLYRFLHRTLAILIIALVLNFFFSYLFYTPKMWALRARNNQIVAQYEQLNRRIEVSMGELEQIKSHDRDLYRSIFAADTISTPWLWNSYPESRYENIGFGRYASLMNSSAESLDVLSRMIYSQSISLDQIEYYSMTKDVMMEHLPTSWPMDKNRIRGRIGAFGSRVDPVYRSIRFHQGIDMGGTTGLPIYATGNGQVIAKHESGYGLQVMIDHNFGYKTRYAHLSRILVQPGQWVKRGEKIGEMGSTGKSTGTHLHYEVIFRGKPVNPINYLSRDMSSDEFREIIQNARATTFEKD